MATPLILMATHEQNTARDQSTTNKVHLGSEEPKPETSKTRARKSGKGSNPKKQPQRGLGVAQLERLRMEERLKKMSEIAQLQQQQQPLNLLDQYNFQKVSDPLGSVPVQYGGGGPGPVVINGSYNGTGTGTGLYGFERGGGLAVQRIGNGGFGCGSSGSGFNVSGTRINPILVEPNPYGIVGAPDQREKVGANLYETSKELSSMPKMHTSSAVVFSDRCDVCCKKKRFNGESSIVVHGGKEKCSKELPMGGTNIFLGLNSESISPLIGETFGLGAGASLRSTGSRGFGYSQEGKPICREWWRSVNGV
ncbi:protein SPOROCYTELESS isoform X2 [Ziziphus jujuba]|uniref:Protein SPOROCYTELESS isoform X2 n=1 Tax=Ziziphus jujuba TaxID=326968 RepID=A0A6P6FWJ7_ZIZJJ|nr:protein SPOROCYTELESS isoform X2 [Ziziphus jujuba]